MSSILLSSFESFLCSCCGLGAFAGLKERLRTRKQVMVKKVVLGFMDEVIDDTGSTIPSTFNVGNDL